MKVEDCPTCHAAVVPGQLEGHLKSHQPQEPKKEASHSFAEVLNCPECAKVFKEAVRAEATGAIDEREKVREAERAERAKKDATDGSARVPFKA